MSNNTQLNVGQSGDSLADLDLSTFTSYPNSGKLELTGIYIGSGTLVAPTPVTGANPLPVWLASGPFVSVPITSGSVQVSGSVGVLSGQISISSGLVGVLSGSIGAQVSGAVIVSGNVGVSGNVQLLSGSATIGQIASGGFPIGSVGINSGLVAVLSGSVGATVSGSVQVSGSVGVLSGQISVSSGLVGVLSGSIAAQVSGAVIVSGNVGVSGSAQLLSGNAWIGVTEGYFGGGIVPSVSSGTDFALQIDSAARLLTNAQVSGQIGVLSGQISVSSGLIGVLSGSIGSTVSGSVIVSGNVGVSGNVQLLSGSATIGQIGSGGFPIGTVGVSSGLIAILSGSLGATVSGGVTVSGTVAVLSGLVGVLSGSIGAQVSGSVIVSGNVGVSGSAQLLSGSSWVGITEGIFSPVAVGPASGQPFALQIDGSGRLLVQSISTQVSGTVAVSGAVGATVSGSVIVSGNVGVSGAVQLLSGAGTIGQLSSGGFPIGTVGITSGLVGILSGSIGATVSGSVQVSGNVGVLSGQISVSSGLVGVLSGSIGAQVSGAVIVSGNVGVSGSVQLLSGNAWIGVAEGYYGGGVSPSPASGTTIALQTDSAASLYVSKEGRKKSYASFTSIGFSATASGTLVDVFGLLLGKGASIPIVRLTKALLSFSVSSGQRGIFPLIGLLIKRSTLTNSGISTMSSPIAIAAIDPNDPASQLQNVVYQNFSGYLAGTASYNVRAAPMQVPQNASGAASIPVNFEWTFPDGGAKQPMLTKSGEQFSMEISCPGADGSILANMTIIGGFEWTEE